MITLVSLCLGKEGHLNFHGLAVVKGEPGRLALHGWQPQKLDVKYKGLGSLDDHKQQLRLYGASSGAMPFLRVLKCLIFLL